MPPSRARIGVGLHERYAGRSRFPDRLAPPQSRVHEPIRGHDVNLAEGHLAEAIHCRAKPPLEIVCGLGSQTAPPARHLHGGEDLEGLPIFGLGNRSGRGYRGDVLAPLGLSQNVCAFGLDALFCPAFPATSGVVEAIVDLPATRRSHGIALVADALVDSS